MITAGVFGAGFLLVTLMVIFGAFSRPNLRLTHYLQGRGSLGQDLGLGVFAYLGSIELTLVVAALLGFALFRGLRLLAVLPVHWFSDALGGLLLGLTLLFGLIAYLERKRLVNPGHAALED
jgi:hypothetical protein